MRQTQSFEEIASQDTKILSHSLESRADDPSMGVLKRCALLVGTSDLKLYDAKGESLGDASDAKWPIGSYLAGHGGRILVTIPPGSDESLFNWLTTGDPKRVPSTKKTSAEALADGGFVYNRHGGTHDTVVRDGRVVELKGFRYGLRDVVKSYFFGITAKIAGIFSKKWKEALTQRSVTKHYGVDMDVDKHIKLEGAKPQDQYPGHIYFHYRPATDKEPGSIMFGMEGFAPTDARHSKLGASDPFSMTGGPKWEKMQHSDDKKYPLPAKYNGQRIESLTEEQIAALVKVKTSGIKPDIVKATPAGTLAGTTFVRRPKLSIKVHAPEQMHPQPPRAVITQTDKQAHGMSPG